MKNLTLLFFVSLALLLTLPAMAQYQVGHSSFSFIDASRNNYEVYGEFYYPADVAGDDVAAAIGEFPIIVFGHGFVTAWSEYDIWWDELVPCGYIMVFPRTQGSLSPTHSDFGIDLSFLVDTFLAENDNPSSILHQRVSDKAALMGHSMGGGCAFLAAEQNMNTTTMITLAAAETTTSAIAAAAGIAIPALTIVGSEDCVVDQPGNQIPMYNNLASPYKGYLDITGGRHCNFGINSAGSNCGLGELFCFGGISQAAQHTQMLAASKPWLDYYLLEDCDAWPAFQDYVTTNNGTLHTYQEAGVEAGCPPPGCAPILTLDDADIPSGIYQAGEAVLSAGQLAAGADVDYVAKDSIVLRDGFCVPLTADFQVVIDSCQ